jgi:hypothetical protein
MTLVYGTGKKEGLMNAPEKEQERKAKVMKAIVEAIDKREREEEKWTTEKPCPVCGDYCWRTDPFEDDGEGEEEQGEEKR